MVKILVIGADGSGHYEMTNSIESELVTKLGPVVAAGYEFCSMSMFHQMRKRQLKFDTVLNELLSADGIIHMDTGFKTVLANKKHPSGRDSVNISEELIYEKTFFELARAVGIPVLNLESHATVKNEIQPTALFMAQVAVAFITRTKK